VYWEHKRGINSTSGATKVYVNGVAIGSVRTSTTVYASESEEITVKLDDLIKIYGYANYDYPDIESIYARNMTINFSEFVNNDP